MATCREVSQWIAEEGLSDAGWRKRLAARFHLLMCKHCRRYTAQLESLGVAARRLFDRRTRDQDPDVLDRLERAIMERTDPGERD